MKAIIDSKHNLARGFADLHTPSQVEHELVYNWQERREELKGHIQRLTDELKVETDKSRQNTLKCLRAGKKKSLDAMGVRINKRVNLKQLLIDRLRQVCNEDEFARACILAKEDKARILEQMRDDDE